MKTGCCKAFSWICAISLLLTCVPCPVLSEEVVMASDPSPEFFDQYPFLDDEIYIDDSESDLASGITEEDPAPVEAEVQDSAPVGEIPETQEPAVIREEPAPAKTAETPASPKNVEEPADVTLEENTENSGVTTGEVPEAAADHSANDREKENESVPAEAAQEPESTAVAGEAQADYVLNLSETPDQFSWNISGTLEAGKECVLRIHSENAENLLLVLTSGTELSAVLTTEENDDQLPFVKETAETTEENEAIGNRYTLEQVSCGQGSGKLIHLSAEADADFSLQVTVRASRPAEQAENAVDAAAENAALNGNTAGEQPEKEESNETDQPEQPEVSAKTKSESKPEHLQPTYKVWIASDEATQELSNTLDLTAAAETELDDGIIWQIRTTEDAEWKNIWYGKTCSLEITDENANSVLRFKTSDGVCSEEFSLIVQEPETEKSEIEETEPEEMEPERTKDEETEEPDSEEQPETGEDEALITEEAPVRSVSFTITADGDVLHLGDVAHFNAELVGYEGLDYTLQWQMSADNETWEDIPEQTGLQMDVVRTEENSHLFWRVIVKIQQPQPDEEQSKDMQPEEALMDEKQSSELSAEEEQSDEAQPDDLQNDEDIGN